MYSEENTLSISILHPHFMTPCAVAQLQNPGPDTVNLNECTPTISGPATLTAGR